MKIRGLNEEGKRVTLEFKTGLHVGLPSLGPWYKCDHFTWDLRKGRLVRWVSEEHEDGTGLLADGGTYVTLLSEVEIIEEPLCGDVCSTAHRKGGICWCDGTALEKWRKARKHEQ